MKNTSVFNKATFKAFTLIELMIVIAILGILASVVVTAYPRAQQGARDSQRISDIKQYQAGLEIYANANNGTYPSTANFVDIESLCISGTLHMNPCPQDSDDQSYQYRSDGLEYVIYIQLEEEHQGSTQWYTACSDGRVDNLTSDPSVLPGCPL